MTTRKRNLKADPQGRYRPRIGWAIGADGKVRQPRFNLGTDKKEAERRYVRLQDLFEDCGRNCDLDPGESVVWPPLALHFAEQLAKGKTVVECPPHTKSVLTIDFDQPTREVERDPELDYAQVVEQARQRYPSLHIAPADPGFYDASFKRNQQLVAGELQYLESFLRSQGVPLSNGGLPDRLIAGSLHEALDHYAQNVRSDGPKLDGGGLKPYQRLRIVRVDRLKREHSDIPLYNLNYDEIAKMVAFWRDRPTTLRATRSSKDNVRHHLGELFRFLRWLDVTEKFQWAMPRGVEALPRKVTRLANERKLTAITKQTYTPEQLAAINKHAKPLERLALYLGLNCAMGAAEIGRLTVRDFSFHRTHPEAARLGFTSTDEDSFLTYFRAKTEVFGEWLLWPETVEMTRWAIERATKCGENLLFVWEKTGKPMYDESLANPQAAFANIWSRLLRRVLKSDPDFPKLPFGTLRDTLPDVLRRDISDDLASLCLAHGSPSKADNLLERYSNKPFGRFFNALREMRRVFAPVFAAVTNPLAAATKQYLPLAVKERILVLLAQNKGVPEIAAECGVSEVTVYRERKLLRDASNSGK